MKFGRTRDFYGACRELFRRQDGSITVEFVIWMPVFLIILAFTADAATIYVRQANMWNVARDTARAMATGQVTTVSAAKTYAGNELLFQGAHYTITPTFPTATSTNDSVEISLPIQYAGVFDALVVFGGFNGTQMDVKFTMLSE